MVASLAVSSCADSTTAPPRMSLWHFCPRVRYRASGRSSGRIQDEQKTTGAATPRRDRVGRPGRREGDEGADARRSPPSSGTDGRGAAEAVHDSGRGRGETAHPRPLGPLTATALGREGAPGAVAGWCGTPARMSVARAEGAVKGKATAMKGQRFKLRVLRLRCIDCAGSTQKATRCHLSDRELWDYRTGHRPKGYKAKRTPLRALRVYCISCCDGSHKEVRLCPAYDCPLWPCGWGGATGEQPARAEP